MVWRYCFTQTFLTKFQANNQLWKVHLICNRTEAGRNLHQSCIWQQRNWTHGKASLLLTSVTYQTIMEAQPITQCKTQKETMGNNLLFCKMAGIFSTLLTYLWVFPRFFCLPNHGITSLSSNILVFSYETGQNGFFQSIVRTHFRGVS